MVASSLFTQWGIPISVFVVSISCNTKVLMNFFDVFYHQYDTHQQVSVVLLLFGMIFTCISIAIQFVQQVQNNDANVSFSRGGVMRSSSSSLESKSVDYSSYPCHEIMKDDTTDLIKFTLCYPTIRQEIIQYLEKENQLLGEASQWIQTMMDANVPGGKLNRGTTVLNVYTTIRQQEKGIHHKISAIETVRACILGWSIEFLQAFFLVADDIMDDSQTRRGSPCWYKLPNVGLIAINDSFLLESFVFQLIKTHFQTEMYYVDLVELLLDVTQKTELGQLLDLTSQPLDHSLVDLSRFTMERYTKIVQYKTAYYSFYLPVAMGMLLSGITSKEAYLRAKHICCLMGEYFQIQDDYLDCYGTPEVIGKVGTDIQDNKCSWLVVQALQLCTEQQRSIIQANYGSWDTNKVQNIKKVYLELKLTELFKSYEEESYCMIQKELNNVSKSVGLPRNVFELLLQKIYKRSK